MSKLPYILSGVAVLVLGLAGAFYVREREARIRVEAESKVRQELISKLDQQIKEADAQAERKVQVIRQAARQVRTPSQAVAALPRVMQLPSPIFEERDESSPDAPSRFVIPRQSIVPLYQFGAECEANAILLGTCQANRVKLEEKVAVLEQDRDQWKVAAKGGSKWQKVKGALKVVGCSAAGGGVGALAGGSKDRSAAAMGAAIGAAGGAVVCSIF